MKAYSHLSAQEYVRIDELRNRDGLGVRQIALRIGHDKSAVSHECLYQWIHVKPQKALDLRRYLPRGKRHRTRAKGRRSKGPRIGMRVPITERPKRVGSRREFGHYESDTVVGASPSRRCVDTQVERKSRRLFARFIDDKSALATARRIRHPQGHPRAGEDRPDLGQRHRILLPPARGRGAGHAHLSRGPVLLPPARVEREPQRAHPRYLPKRTGFDDLTDADLQAIVQEINDTPMKVLNRETPNEVWYRELGKAMSKTSHPKTNVALTN